MMTSLFLLSDLLKPSVENDHSQEDNQEPDSLQYTRYLQTTVHVSYNIRKR